MRVQFRRNLQRARAKFAQWWLAVRLQLPDKLRRAREKSINTFRYIFSDVRRIAVFIFGVLTIWVTVDAAIPAFGHLKAFIEHLIWHDREWHSVAIKLMDGKDIAPQHWVWSDISSTDQQNLWLTGFKGIQQSKRVNGRQETAGQGILLHTFTGGELWSTASISDGGCNHHSSSRHDTVGPLTAIEMYSRGPDKHGNYNPEGWAVGDTGAYEMCPDANRWMRSALPSNNLQFFTNFAQVEAFHEIYAVGWSGLQHIAPQATSNWDAEIIPSPVPSVPIPPGTIFDVKETGGAASPNAWAVGASLKPALCRNSEGSKPYAAIYHLESRGSAPYWHEVALPPDVANALHSCDMLVGVGLYNNRNRDAGIVAVGDNGLIVRGSYDAQNGQPIWQATHFPMKGELLAVSTDDRGNIWVVGNHQTILESRDYGRTWRQIGVPADAKDHDFYRIKFLGGTGWILGDNILLKSTPEPTATTQP